MDSAKRDRALRHIARLGREDFDLVTLWKRSSEVLVEAIPEVMSHCWFTLDPTSLLATSHFQEGLPEIPGEWLAQEYLEPDYNKMAEVARSPRGIATLDEATGGHPERSPRYLREMVPFGARHEVIAALRTRSGDTWGALGLYRAEGAPPFDAGELGFLAAAAPHLAEGARRALLTAEAHDPDSPAAPGLLVFDERLKVLTLSPNVESWLDDLPGGATEGALPPVVYAVAGQALAAGEAAPDGAAGLVRVLGRSGRWLVVHGSPLVSAGRTRRAAVIIEAASPARLTPLLMAAYDLTGREQQVTRLVLQGESTAQIGTALGIAPNTVQQHLKGIFEKTGVHSRRDLTAKLFFAHYEPRLRDNEQRAATDRPVRGGPYPTWK